MTCGDGSATIWLNTLCGKTFSAIALIQARLPTVETGLKTEEPID
jgi:hypothetical protein